MGGLNAFDTLHIAGIFFLVTIKQDQRGNITARHCMSVLMKKSLSVLSAVCNVSLRFNAYMCHKINGDWHVENKSNELINTPRGKSDYLKHTSGWFVIRKVHPPNNHGLECMCKMVLMKERKGETESKKVVSLIFCTCTRINWKWMLPFPVFGRRKKPQLKKLLKCKLKYFTTMCCVCLKSIGNIKGGSDTAIWAILFDWNHSHTHDF